MTKSDDSSLTAHDLRIIEERAQQILNRASAWGVFPTPIDDILAAAKVRLAPTSMFDPVALLSYLQGKAMGAAFKIKSALSKVFGLYDGGEELIHIDSTVTPSKQSFLKLHETAHHDIPAHRKTFRFFQDCERTLDPEIADQFEREANNFARFAIFQGDGYMRMAADHPFEIKTPIKLAKKFGASIYASCREFARTNPKACVVYVLEPIEFVQGRGARARVRRVEASSSFRSQFGRPADTVITLDDPLGRVLPIGRKMTRPVTLSMMDLNGTSHECVAEAFDTTYNVVILLYPVRALTSTTIIMPSGFKKAACK